MNYLNLFLLARHRLKVIGIICFLQSAFVFSSQAQQSLIHIMAKYGGYDMDRNGTKEIESLSYLPFEAPNSQEVPKDGNLVLVFVEPRLLQDIPDSKYSKQELLNRLERWKGDIRAEGYYSRFIAARVYSGPEHQDGRTVLAMRKFLQDVYAMYPNLKGVMLVGSFPEAMLVRQWLWKREKSGEDTLTIKGKKYTNVTYIQSIPECISHRTDITLGDLNGNWENIYHQQAKTVSCLRAIPNQSLPGNWPVLPALHSPIVTSKAYEFFKSESFEDFFYVNDAKLDIIRDNGVQLEMRAYPNQHPELAPSDRSWQNPTAQPEIVVSRINTRHIAFNYKPESGLVDANGNPTSYKGRKIKFSTAIQPSAAMERTLLIEYFDRNHLHRVGAYNHLPFNLASADGKDFDAYDMNSFLDNASSTWKEKKVYSEANLEEYIHFLKYNAAVKGYMAHGSRKYMQFYKVEDPNRLAAITGVPYLWSKKEINPKNSIWEYKPSLQDLNDMADWSLHRTLWQNKKLATVRPTFYFFYGCEANSPENAENVPYSDPSYGAFNNAENILYFLNGLAAMTRAKTFNDNIDGFPGALKKNIYSNLGDGWKAHYKYVAQHTVESPASNKRSYWWSVLGDWTLRLKYKNGAAILGFKKDKPDFEGKAVLADYSQIGSSANITDKIELSTSTQRLVPAGDLNNDKKEDFLIFGNGEQGIAAAYHDGARWQSLLSKPDKIKFGDWHFNNPDVIGSDQILGHGDFDNNGSHEILIQSNWGWGILSYSATGRTFTSLVANKAGTVYSDQGVSWTYQTDDVVEAIADFNGDKSSDILIRSSKGRAVLTYFNGKLYPLMVVNFGTSSAAPGGKAWIHEPTDQMVGTADFAISGNTKSILLLHPSKGLGIMNVTNSLPAQFLVQSIQKYGTLFGTWYFKPSDNKIAAIGDFTKDGRDELLITSPSSMALITPTGSLGSTTFTSLVMKPNNTNFGAWNFQSATDKIRGTGDFDADGAAEILIRKENSLGVLKYNATNKTFDCPEMIFYNSSYLTKSIDGWYPEDDDIVLGIGNFDGLTGDEIFIRKDNFPPPRRLKSVSASEVELATTTTEAISGKVAQVFVYPNPVQDILNLRVRSTEVTTVQITNFQGNVLITEPVKEVLDVSTLLPGMYIVNFKNSLGVIVETHKIIKK